MLFVEPYFGEKSLKGYLSCFSPHYHPPLNQHGFSVDAKKSNYFHPHRGTDCGVVHLYPVYTTVYTPRAECRRNGI